MYVALNFKFQIKNFDQYGYCLDFQEQKFQFARIFCKTVDSRLVQVIYGPVIISLWLNGVMILLLYGP